MKWWHWLPATMLGSPRSILQRNLTFLRKIEKLLPVTASALAPRRWTKNHIAGFFIRMDDEYLEYGKNYSNNDGPKGRDFMKRFKQDADVLDDFKKLLVCDDDMEAREMYNALWDAFSEMEIPDLIAVPKGVDPPGKSGGLQNLTVLEDDLVDLANTIPKKKRKKRKRSKNSKKEMSRMPAPPLKKQRLQNSKPEMVDVPDDDDQMEDDDEASSDHEDDQEDDNEDDQEDSDEDDVEFPKVDRQIFDNLIKVEAHVLCVDTGRSSETAKAHRG
eukprot:TRINITY_DN665_c0_g1_i1.p1 TRINITY_DN665_c0_g1~~TRINITY_DN665_c0_g1_i1.p1  ORF type:complete len:273 (+),score=66.71 TRINITY_DN665_c0_g1_i1:96-914(+)